MQEQRETVENIIRQKVNNVELVHTTDPKYTNNPARTKLKIATTGVVVLDPYAIFVGLSLTQAFILIIERFGSEPPEEFIYFLNVISPFVIFLCYCSDLFGGDPSVKADEWLDKNLDEGETSLAQNVLQKVVEGNALLSYAAGSLANGSFICLLTSGISNPYLRMSINTIGIAILDIQGVIFYHIFGQDRNRRHVKKFIELINDPIPRLRHMKKNWRGHSEAIFQILINAIKRALDYGGIVITIFMACFGLEQSNPVLAALSCVAFISTLLNTFFSRSEGTLAEYASIPSEFIQQKDLQYHSVNKKTKLGHFTMSSLRATTASFLLFRILPSWPYYINYATTAVSFMAINKLSYDAKIEQTLYKLIHDIRPKKANTLSATIHAPHLLLESNKPLSKIELFDLFAKLKYETPFVRLFSELINSVPRGSRGLILTLFVDAFAQTVFGIKLDGFSLIAITLLAGMEITIADKLSYNLTLPKHVLRFVAKVNAELEIENKKASDISSLKGKALYKCRFFTSVVKAIANNPNDYKFELKNTADNSNNTNNRGIKVDKFNDKNSVPLTETSSLLDNRY